MNIQQYLEEMKKIQENLLVFIENESNNEENFAHLNTIFENIKIHEDKHKLMSLLKLLLKISNNHHRGPTFFNKIEQILLVFQKDIKNFYSNSEIFNTFMYNKRILLFLLEQRIMIMDEHIVKKIIRNYLSMNYPQYFLPEIKPFMNEKWFPKYDPERIFTENDWVEGITKELPENFYENRKTGENENQICKLIRNDLIEDFIIYIRQNNYSLKSEICSSIYETNYFINYYKYSRFALNSKINLIEYAAFFGSYQIFKYLHMNGIELTPSLWLFAIHGRDTNIIHLLIENHIEPTILIQRENSSNGKETEIKSYKNCFLYSINFHHNDIAKYILTNFIKKKGELLLETFYWSLGSYNFHFIQNDMINENSFVSICNNGYYLFAENLLKYKNIDINAIITELFNKVFHQIIQ